MTDDRTPEDAFGADMDRLRAEVGAARLEEAERRGIGEQMLTDALFGVMAADEAAERMKSMEFFCRPAEPGWGWEENNGE